MTKEEKQQLIIVLILLGIPFTALVYALLTQTNGICFLGIY
jgi:hypothetical protein